LGKYTQLQPTQDGKSTPSGDGAQILWRVEGHHDHVHVGVRGDLGSVGKGTVDIKISYDYTNMLPDRRPRSGKPSIIVLHDTESHNAVGTSDLKQLGTILKNQGLSVHVGIDAEGNIARYVKDGDVAFHVASYNAKALGIEQIGMATQTSWPKAQTDSAAKMVAYWANKYDIPIKHSIEHGVCTHKDLGASGGGHADPGAGYPFDEVLSKAQDYLGQVVDGQSASGDASGDSGSGGDTSVANAFAASFNFPTIDDSLEAIALTGNRSLMNDQPLLPFIQQLCDASLRQFQSLPDGRFYAFYPDYFGEMLHHPPYWEIDDIEVLNGGINLSDDALVTHMLRNWRYDLADCG
jgi:N-acetyl-anhydromuramyl-L-alanine amidase AmpD